MQKKYLVMVGISAMLITCLLGCNASKKDKSSDKTSKSEISTEIDETMIENTEDIGDETNIQYTDYANIKNPFGSINGKELSFEGNNFQETFGSDGFTLEESEDSVGVACLNDKYKDVTLILYNNNTQHISDKDILEKGFYGYHIDGQTDNKPDMNWGGLTWGASIDDIKATYGEPAEMIQGDNYVLLTYKFTPEAQITFYVYNESNELTPYAGLQDVDLYIYKDDELSQLSEELIDETINNTQSAPETSQTDIPK